MAREAGGLVIAVATMPFDCEGARRRQQALAGLEQLRAAADVLLCLPHQRVLKALDENTSLVEAFQHTEKLLGQGVNGIWQMLSQPGLIQADFADLRRALMGRQVQGAFASVEAAGEHRVREAIEKLTASPLLEGGTLLAEAETVLVNLRAGVDLAVGEIERVTDQIQRRCESAQLIVGAAVDASMGDRLSLTVVAAHRLAIPAPPSSGAPLRKAHPKEDWVGGDSLFARAGTESSRGAGGVDASRALRDLREVAPSGGGPDKAGSARARIRMEQALLPLESASKGRFEKSEPTLYQGEDLDVPTYVRRGVVLN
jgi:cell division protein FtsZ